MTDKFGNMLQLIFQMGAERRQRELREKEMKQQQEQFAQRMGLDTKNADFANSLKAWEAFANAGHAALESLPSAVKSGMMSNETAEFIRNAVTRMPEAISIQGARASERGYANATPQQQGEMDTQAAYRARTGMDQGAAAASTTGSMVQGQLQNPQALQLLARNAQGYPTPQQAIQNNQGQQQLDQGSFRNDLALRQLWQQDRQSAQTYDIAIRQVLAENSRASLQGGMRSAESTLQAVRSYADITAKIRDNKNDKNAVMMYARLLNRLNMAGGLGLPNLPENDPDQISQNVGNIEQQLRNMGIGRLETPSPIPQARTSPPAPPAPFGTHQLNPSAPWMR